jgi:opacity protein-like surface antigen
MKSFQHLCAVLLCILASQAAPAADLPLPAAQQQGAISFVTGGIGSDEAQAFRSAAAQYNLRLTLAAVSGEFFAGVRVTLRDAQGNTVVEAVSDGPYLFLNVPPGRYQVTADNLGQVQRRNALVRTKGATELYLRWKTTTEQ